MDELRRENEALREENRQLHNENMRLVACLGQTQGVTGHLAIDNVVLARDLEHTTARLNEVVTQEHARRLDAAHKRAEEQQGEIEMLQATVKALERENAALRAQNDRLSTENKQLRASVEALTARVKKLGDELASVKEETTARVEKLGDELASVKEEMHMHKKLLLDRSAVEAVSTALAQCLWPEGHRRPYRLNTLRQMLRFIEDVRAGKTPTGYCGDNAYSTFSALTDAQKAEVYARYDKFLADATAHGIPSLIDASDSLNSIKQLATSVAHPLRGKFAKIASKVELALTDALAAARDDPDADEESVLDLEDAVKLAAFAKSATV